MGDGREIKASLEDTLDVEAWVEQMIAEHGYAQISMHDPDAAVPGFAFTIGLEHSRSVPELMCMGVAPDVAGQLFGLCVEACDERTLDLSQGNQTVAGLVDGYRLRFQRVAPAVVAAANAVRPHRATDLVDMVQLLIPDNAGRFPGETDCDPRVAAAQDPDRLLARSTN